MSDDATPNLAIDVRTVTGSDGRAWVRLTFGPEWDMHVVKLPPESAADLARVIATVAVDASRTLITPKDAARVWNERTT